MLAAIASILPIVVQLAVGFFDDKPNIKKAILIGSSMAEVGIEGYTRFASIADKISSMPEGQDFTDEELSKMSETRDVVLDGFAKMLERRQIEALRNAP